MSRDSFSWSGIGLSFVVLLANVLLVESRSPPVRPATACGCFTAVYPSIIGKRCRQQSFASLPCATHRVESRKVDTRASLRSPQFRWQIRIPGSSMLRGVVSRALSSRGGATVAVAPPAPPPAEQQQQQEKQLKPYTAPDVSMGVVPMANSSFWNVLSFGWVDPLMARGNEKPLEMTDLWNIQEQDRMANLSARFHTMYAEEVSRAASKGIPPDSDARTAWLTSPFTRTIVRLFSGSILWTGLLKFLSSMMQFAPPIIVNRLLKILEAGTSLDAATGYRLTAILGASIVAKTALENQYYHHISVMGLQIKGLIKAAVYRKSLRLSPAARQNSTVGEIVNMMQLDAGRLETVASQIHTTWNGLMEIVGYMALLVACMGPSMLAGIAIMVSVIPLNAVFLGVLAKAREKTLQFTDQRVKLTNEVFSGIRSIKSYAWEMPFLEQVSKLRKDELNTITAAAKIRGALVSLLGATPPIISCVVLGVYVALGNTISAAKIFTAIALFNQLRFPLLFYPMVITAFAEGRVALRRVQSFLDAQEVTPRTHTQARIPVTPASGGVAGQSEGDFGGMKGAVGVGKGQGEGAEHVQQQHLRRDAHGHDDAVHLHPQHQHHQPQVLDPQPQPLHAIPRGGSVTAATRTSAEHPPDSLTTPSAYTSQTPLHTTDPTHAGTHTHRPPSTTHTHAHTTPKPGIHLSDAEFAYGYGRPRLKNVSLSVAPGELVAVIGSLGSGKSSLIRALLGEMVTVKGQSEVRGRLAYVPQSSWVPNQSFRDCVLFGLPLDETCYALAVDACGLGPDLSRLEAGHDTEIGERGVTLSGGQKQRLSLARAVYSDADVYLLDDPLSALDAQVGNEVFDGCIRRRLSSKARLLVTNQLQYLPYVDRVVIMGREGDDFGVVDQGTYGELVRRGYDLEEMLAASQSGVRSARADSNNMQDGGETDGEEDMGYGGAEEVERERVVMAEQQQQPPWNPQAGDSSAEGPRSTTPSQTTSIPPTPTPHTTPRKPTSSSKKRGGLMTAEERVTGAVKADVYKSYLGSVRSPVLLGLVLLSFIVANATQFLQQAVISWWTADPLSIKHPTSFYMLGVSSMAGLAALFSFLRTYLSVLAGVRSSQHLHYKALSRVLRAPMSYFDTTPLGQLVQRFSSDLDQIDQQLPGTLGMVIMCVFQIGGALTAILAATPIFSVAVLPIAYIYLRAMNYFRSVTRELKRLDSLSRSPIYTHLSESLGGLSVIRAFAREKSFIRANEHKVDDNMRSYFGLKAADRWLSVRLELLGAICVASSAMLSVRAAASGRLQAGLAGLALTNALGVTGLLNWAVRCFADTEAQMNSVERVKYLIDNVPSEGAERVLPPRPQALAKKHGKQQPHVPTSQRGVDAAKQAVAVLSQDMAPAQIPSPPLQQSPSGTLATSGASQAMAEMRGEVAAGQGWGGVDSTWPTTPSPPPPPPSSTLSPPAAVGATTPPSSTGVTASGPGGGIARSEEQGYTDDAALEASGWPWRGTVYFRNAVLRYRPDTDPVLQRFSVAIRPREKIGIVGRTGAGKSSLFVSLLRLVELEAGSIEIDGVDVSKVGLSTLRSAISVIPQDPVLFSGTLRSNLDPFNRYPDEALWSALGKAHLDGLVRSSPLGLDQPVAEYGENLSQGQRQLICLARALVRRSRILLLDEATSSVDYETDALIQSTIRREFADCTVLTIAHRLETIMDSSRILVMDSGRLAEFDRPRTLLRRHNSVFSELVRSAEELELQP